MRNIVVGIIICLVTQVTSGQFVLAQQSAITACSACDNDELLIKINKFRGFQNEFNSGNHDIGAVHRFADAYAKLLFTIDKATRQQSEMAIPCLKLLGLSLNDEWINLDIDNIVKNLQEQIIQNYAAEEVLKQLVLLSSIKDDGASGAGLYQRALIQLSVDKVLSEDESTLNDFSYQLAYKQLYSPTFVAERAPNIPLAAKQIAEHKKTQLLRPSEYPEKIKKANVFMLGLGVLSGALNTALYKINNSEVNKFFGTPSEQKEFIQKMGMPYNELIIDAFDSPIFDSLKRVYRSYLENSPNGMAEAKARVLYLAGVDMDSELYIASNTQPLLLHIPEMADQIYDTVIELYPNTSAAADARQVLVNKNKDYFGNGKFVIAGGVVALSAYWLGVGAFAAAVVVEGVDLATGAGEAIHHSAGWSGTIAWEALKGIASGGLDQVRKGLLKEAFTYSGNRELLIIGKRLMSGVGFQNTAKDINTYIVAKDISKRLEQGLLAGTASKKFASAPVDKALAIHRYINNIENVTLSERLPQTLVRGLVSKNVKGVERELFSKIPLDRVNLMMDHLVDDLFTKTLTDAEFTAKYFIGRSEASQLAKDFLISREKYTIFRKYGSINNAMKSVSQNATGEYVVSVGGKKFHGSVYALVDANEGLAAYVPIAQKIQLSVSGQSERSVLGLSGSFAQGRAHIHPGDIDLAEHLDVVAGSISEAAERIAQIVKKTAEQVSGKPGVAFSELKLGIHPETKKGIKWGLDEIKRGEKVITLSTGGTKVVTLAKAAEDPGMLKFDWFVIDKGQITEATNTINLRILNKEGATLMTRRDPVSSFQEIYLGDPKPFGLLEPLYELKTYKGYTDDFLKRDVAAYGIVSPGHTYSPLKAAKRAYSYYRGRGEIDKANSFLPLFQSPYSELSAVADRLGALETYIARGGNKFSKEQLAEQIRFARNYVNSSPLFNEAEKKLFSGKLVALEQAFRSSQRVDSKMVSSSIFDLTTSAKNYVAKYSESFLQSNPYARSLLQISH